MSKSYTTDILLNLINEFGDVVDSVKKYITNGKRMNKINALEEIGDIEIYLEGLRHELNTTPKLMAAATITPRLQEKRPAAFHAAPCSALPPVLDACCGSRMFWFDKQDERALFVDNRREAHPIDIGTPGTIGRSPIVVDPDILADFRELPFPDDSFSLVVFDPPHIERTAAKGLLTRKYGHLDGDWREMLRAGFAECFRVLKPEGTLIFKWAESDHPVSEILKLTPHRPLFGHRSGKSSATHWVAFLKQNDHRELPPPTMPKNTSVTCPAKRG